MVSLLKKNEAKYLYNHHKFKKGSCVVMIDLEAHYYDNEYKIIKDQIVAPVTVTLTKRLLKKLE